jgi:hypothetical protein
MWKVVFIIFNRGDYFITSRILYNNIVNVSMDDHKLYISSNIPILEPTSKDRKCTHE